MNYKERKVYTLTENGIALIPILLEMLVWGFKFDNTLTLSGKSGEMINVMVERAENDKEALLKEITTSVRNFDSKNYC
jgi:DNA-binding PadR family transcriptional regulator